MGAQEVVAASQWLSLPHTFTPLHNGSHEGNEVWLCEGNEKGELLKSIATEHDEDQGPFEYLEQPCYCCRKGSQEDRCVHHPRSLPHQDQDQASKDSCESFSSCCPKAADLRTVP